MLGLHVATVATVGCSTPRLVRSSKRLMVAQRAVLAGRRQSFAECNRVVVAVYERGAWIVSGKGERAGRKGERASRKGERAKREGKTPVTLKRRVTPAGRRTTFKVPGARCYSFFCGPKRTMGKSDFPIQVHLAFYCYCGAHYFYY